MLGLLHTGNTGPQALAEQPLMCSFAAHAPCSNSPSSETPGHFLVRGLTLNLGTQLLQVLLCHVGKSAVGPKITLSCNKSHRAP